MQVSEFLNVKGKTKFRLRLELTIVVFTLLVSQALLLITPPLELVVSLLAVLWMNAVSKEMKTRREPLTRRQKHAVFGLDASLYGVVLIALLIAAIIRRTPLVWIVFGIAAVLILAALFYDYDQLYTDADAQ